MSKNLKTGRTNVISWILMVVFVVGSSVANAQAQPSQASSELPQINIEVPPKSLSNGKKLTIKPANSSDASSIGYQFISSPKSGGDTIRFSNGAEVSLTVAEPIDRILNVPMEVNFSTCANSFKKPICKLTYPVIAQQIRARWSKHPDKRMLGKELVRADGGKLVDDDASYSDDFSSIILPYNTRADLAPTFSCEDYSWLNESGSLPEKLVIREWSQEINSENDETGASENRSIQSILSLTLDKINSDSYRFSPSTDLPRKILVLGDPGDLSNVPAVAGDVIGWNVVTAESGNCDIGFRISLDAIGNDLDAREKAEKPYNRKNFPYLWSETLSTTKFNLPPEARPYLNQLPNGVLKLFAFGFLSVSSVETQADEIKIGFSQQNIIFKQQGAK